MALVERLPTSTSKGRLGSPESQGSASAAEVRPASAGLPRRALDRAAAFHFLRDIARHPFSSILGKVFGIALLFIGLSAIGAYATLKGTKKATVKLVEHTSASLAAPGGEWLMTQTLNGPAMTGAPSASSTGPPSEPPPSTPSPGITSPGITSDGKVILNLASAEDLRRLPGVGQKRAEAILSLRQKLGRFRRATDLLRVRGLGPKRLKKLLPHLVLDPPQEKPSSDPSSPTQRVDSPKILGGVRRARAGLWRG